jgi:hypothetical protein
MVSQIPANVIRATLTLVAIILVMVATMKRMMGIVLGGHGT